MEIQSILGYMLNTSARFIKRKMDTCLQEYGITTSQWAVLKLLHSRGSLSQALIAQELMADRATTGSIIHRLYEKEYIEKVLDKKDRRSYVIQLTPKAAEIIKELETMATNVTNEALQGLCENEVEILYKSLNQVINNLSKEEDK